MSLHNSYINGVIAAYNNKYINLKVMSYHGTNIEIDKALQTTNYFVMTLPHKQSNITHKIYIFYCYVCVISSTLPETNSCVATKEHVQKILHFMCDFESKPHSNHNMPCWSKLLIHGVLDHFSSSLSVHGSLGWGGGWGLVDEGQIKLQ